MTNKRPFDNPSTRPGLLPAIGITGLDDRPTLDQHAPRFGQNQTYFYALARAGAAPLLIPNLTDKTLLRTLYELLDGLLLSGGEDVDPARYGETRHEKCGSISPDRDEVELTLVRWAMDDKKPLLAICRGIQVLNVALGGSLYQDIQAQVPGANRHDWYPNYPRNRLSHTVHITPQTHLARILETGSPRQPLSGSQVSSHGLARRDEAQDMTLPVNSLHHQSVKDVAPGLIVAARAPDGIIEAVEAEGHPFAIGVQWHPEELANGDARAQWIFDALVEACQNEES